MYKQKFLVLNSNYLAFYVFNLRLHEITVPNTTLHTHKSNVSGNFQSDRYVMLMRMSVCVEIAHRGMKIC